MASHEELLSKALKLDEGRLGRYCRPVDPDFLEALNKKKPTTMAGLADIWYTTQGASYGRSQHYNSSRYHMLSSDFSNLTHRQTESRTACMPDSSRVTSSFASP